MLRRPDRRANRQRRLWLSHRRCNRIVFEIFIVRLYFLVALCIGAKTCEEFRNIVYILHALYQE